MDHPNKSENDAIFHDGQITWDQIIRRKFQEMLAKIPIFLRGIAEKKVTQKAEEIVRKEKRLVVGEKDLVDAFFLETPFGFHGPMKYDMQELGIDYTKYGYPK